MATAQLKDSADLNCHWCSLILTILSGYPGEWEAMSSEDRLHIEFGLGGWENTSPPGNNMFQVLLYTDARWLANEELFAYSKVDDRVITTVTAREVQSTVDSDAAYGQARRWLEECGTHDACPSRTGVLVPSRLIDVRPSREPTRCRLMNTSDGLEHQGSYVALSYCWGPAQVGVTTSDNLNTRLAQLLESELSRTAQDAIRVTRKLGHRYLWIDAVCIVQDSEDDKTQELARMSEIYTHAAVTIVAASSASSADGFLKPRHTPTDALQIPFWAPDGQLGSAHMGIFIESKDRLGWRAEVLNTRAWTLQEQLLSPRLLIYASHTLQFQCNTRFVNLGDSLNCYGPLDNGKLWLPHGEDLTDGRTMTGDAWLDILRVYSRRRLTYPEDRLTALSAIAQHFHGHAPIGSQYLAGLWAGRSLPMTLLWQLDDDRVDSAAAAYDPACMAPTWSWVSVRAPVRYRGDYCPSKCEWHEGLDVTAACCTPVQASLPFGGSKDAWLRLTAQSRKGFVDPFKKRLTWQAPTGMRSGDTDQGVYASLDAKSEHPHIEVCCLAMVYRHRIHTTRALTVAGLLIAPMEDGKAHRRIGVFFDAEKSDFAGGELQEVRLV